MTVTNAPTTTDRTILTVYTLVRIWYNVNIHEQGADAI